MRCDITDSSTEWGQAAAQSSLTRGKISHCRTDARAIDLWPGGNQTDDGVTSDGLAMHHLSLTISLSLSLHPSLALSLVPPRPMELHQSTLPPGPFLSPLSIDETALG